jgi:hypothetical protein
MKPMQFKIGYCVSRVTPGGERVLFPTLAPEAAANDRGDQPMK